MKKSLYIALLFIPILALGLWIMQIELQYKTSPHVKIAATGYDPRDLLSGHYLNLRLDWKKTDCYQFEGNQCPEDRFDWRYRFYLPEQEAKYLDRVIRRTDLDMELEFIYHPSADPLLKQLYIEGLPWDAWINLNIKDEYED